MPSKQRWTNRFFLYNDTILENTQYNDVYPKTALYVKIENNRILIGGN